MQPTVQGQPVRRIAHLPSSMTWRSEEGGAAPAEHERSALERTVRSALERAIRSHRRGELDLEPRGEHAAREARRASAEGSETSPRRDPSRPDASGYSVRSYDSGGEPVAVPVESSAPDDAPSTEQAPPPQRLEFEEPRVLVATRTAKDDRLLDGPSPFDGYVPVILPGWRSVTVRSERYVQTTSLAHALRWGELLFGGRSFLLLETAAPADSPPGSPQPIYYALPTDERVHLADMHAQPMDDIAGHAAAAMTGSYLWISEPVFPEQGAARLRALITVEGNPVFPPRVSLFEQFFHQLEQATAEEGEIAYDIARRRIFDDIERWLAEGRAGRAADRLAELDAHAFALLDPAERARMLGVLLDGWTGEPEEVAVLEIFRSITDRSELDALVGALDASGHRDALLQDLDRVWSLLTELGRRFGDRTPLSLGRLVFFLERTGLGGTGLLPASRIDLSPGSGVAELGEDLLDELEAAASTFARFAETTLEAVWTLLSRPDQVVQGILALGRLFVLVQLARWGHEPSRRLLDDMLERAGESLLDGLLGLEILGGGEHLLRRARWAVIWEVASLLIGVAEVKAALRSVGVGARVLRAETGAGRTARLLGRLEKGDPPSLLEIASSRRTRAGRTSLDDLAEAVQGDAAARSGFERLARRGHDDLLDELLEDILPHDPGLLRRDLRAIDALSDEQTGGLAILQRIDHELPAPHRWFDVFDIPPEGRGALLELVARVAPSVDEEIGLARLVGRGLAPPGTNIQGTLGHLWAARTLQRRFPGARLRFEVDLPGREVDIRMLRGGRQVDVEVKTNLGGRPSIDRRQIRRDLTRHADDGFEDLLYLYHPSLSGELESVRRAMRRAVRDPGVRRALRRQGIDPALAEAQLERALAADLVDVYQFDP